MKSILIYDDGRQITLNGEIDFSDSVGLKVIRGITEVVDGVTVKTYYLSKETKTKIFEKGELFYK